MFTMRAVLDGRAKELIDLAKTNLSLPARSCREYFFVTYSGKAYSVDPGEKCNRDKRILASSVPKLPQLRPVIVG
jgi:hypothetical protein